jgi:hypothetical protein
MATWLVYDAQGMAPYTPNSQEILGTVLVSIHIHQLDGTVPASLVLQDALGRSAFLSPRNCELGGAVQAMFA